MKLFKLNRQIHNWGSIIIAIPVSIVFITGVLLLLKKDIDWIQPSTVRGAETGLSLSFDEILDIASTVPEAGIQSWSDVDRLDVRPGKGMIKVRANNRWEVQIDANNGAVLQVAVRRSDLIESIHDGSFFSDFAKYWIFLPASVVLIGLWITGMILFFQPYVAKSRNKKRRAAKADGLSQGGNTPESQEESREVTAGRKHPAE